VSAEPSRRAIKRIVIDALQLPSELSGLGRQVQAIGRELHGLPGGLELEVRCPRSVRPLLEPLFPAGTRFRTPLARNRPRWLRIALQQIVAPMLDPSSSLLVCVGDQAPVWGRAPVFLVVNDVRRLARTDSSGFLERWYYRTLLPPAVRHASFVATISEFSRREIRRAFGSRVDPVIVAQKPPERPVRSGGADDSLLVVGALRHYKSMETVVEAVSLLPPSRRPSVRFAGSPGKLGADVERQAAALGVAASVEILGWVGDEELDRLYRGALATVHPSRYEGYGLAVAESLSRGVPVVASDIAPHREIAGTAAVYFPPGDARALASAIEAVRSSPDLRERLTASGLARARELREARPSWRELVLQAVVRSDAPRSED
jgi:glycosyltransferase involved in cell wall biosynthesis